MKAVTEGIILGVVVSAMIGPVFFLLVQISVSKGIFAGFLTGIGALISDLIILIICLNGVDKVALDFFSEKLIGLAGIYILATIGPAIIFTPKEKLLTSSQIKFSTPVSTTKSFVQGFSINTFNPFVFVFWAGIAGLIKEQYDGYGKASFFLAGLFTSICILNTLKVILPHTIKFQITPKIVYTISLLCGATLILFASILGFRMLLE